MAYQIDEVQITSAIRVGGDVVVEGIVTGAAAQSGTVRLSIADGPPVPLVVEAAASPARPFVAVAPAPAGCQDRVAIRVHCRAGVAWGGHRAVPLNDLSAPRATINASTAGDLTGFVLLPETTAEPPVIACGGHTIGVLGEPGGGSPANPGRVIRFEIDRIVLAEWAARAVCSGLEIVRDHILVEVVLGGTTLASALLPVTIDAMGRVERHTGMYVHGWIVLKHAPGAVVPISIHVGGVRYADGRASLSRDDLARAGVPGGIGGFASPMRLNPNGAGTAEVTVHVSGASRPVNDPPLVVKGLADPRPQFDWSRIARDARCGPAVTVAVPIYGQPAEVRRCVDSLLAHTTGRARLLLVDDASPDPQILAALGAYRGLSDITVLRNETNRGYVATCNEAMTWAGEDDVVLLNSDTEVGPRWLENLRLAAYSRPNVATVTPLSDNAGAFSAPDLNEKAEWPEGLVFPDVARLVTANALGHLPVVPTGSGFCMYVRRDALDAVGGFDVDAFPRGYGEENDFCIRAARVGLLNVLDDRTYVHHVRSASFGASKAELYAASQRVLQERYPEYDVAKTFFSTDERALVARWRVRRAFLTAPQIVRPRILFVISTTSGGTPSTNRDLMTALVDRFEPWLLRCDGETVTLTEVRPGAEDVLRLSETLIAPLTVHDHRSEHYDRIVHRILVEHAIELVHVRHIGWHGLGLFDACRNLDIPVVLSFHDFYFICPTNKLVDGDCAPCCLGDRWTQTPCQIELWPKNAAPPLKPTFIHRWRKMMGECLDGVAAFVTTSQSARAELVRAHPVLDTANFRVIEHGRDFAAMAAVGCPPARGELLRVLVPGNLSPAKGALFLAEMAASDDGRTVEFHLLGDPGKLVPSPGIVVHGGYARDEFQDRVAAIRPHLGAVLSRWPETYCHTLTEMWASGLPVLASDNGAVGERLREFGGGWLFDMQATSKDVLGFLTEIAADPIDFAAQIDSVRRWQAGHGRSCGTAAMAESYAALYSDVLDRRLAWRTDRRVASSVVPARSTPATAHYLPLPPKLPPVDIVLKCEQCY